LVRPAPQRCVHRATRGGGVLWALAVALVASGAGACDAEALPGSADLDAGHGLSDVTPGDDVEGQAELGPQEIPYVAGALERVYRPQGTRYLNDHTLVRGPGGGWHLYGITHTSDGAPFEERSLLHATANDLYGPWRDEADILTADPALNESALWAPHVVYRDGDYWTMYYAAGVGDGESPARTLRRADSADLVHWVRAESTPTPSERPPGGRDPMVFRDGARWILYSVGVGAGNHGQIVATTNADLDDPDGWSSPVAVVTDPIAGFSWGNLESPFVVRRGGWYYLFLTRTTEAAIDYVRTVVFRSADPLDFGWAPVTELRAHCAELVRDADGGWHLTSGGWTTYVGQENRGLLVAPLGWATPTASTPTRH